MMFVTAGSAASGAGIAAGGRGLGGGQSAAGQRSRHAEAKEQCKKTLFHVVSSYELYLMNGKSRFIHKASRDQPSTLGTKRISSGKKVIISSTRYITPMKGRDAFTRSASFTLPMETPQ